MNSVLAVTLICFILAIGEFLAIKTKSILSSIFVASLIFLVGFQLGLPRSIFIDSALLPLGIIMISFVVTHLGTMISLKKLAEQWKVVLISLSAVIGVLVLVILVGTPLVGQNYSIAAVAPITGSAVASAIIGEAGAKIGKEEISVFAALIITIQGFIGFPLSSILLRKEASKIADAVKNGTHVESINISDKEKRKKFLPELPKKFQTTSFLFLKMGLIILIAELIERLTGGAISKYVLCLILGIVGQEIGLLEENIFEKSNSLGLIMITVMVVVFAPLAKADLGMLISLIKPLVITLSIGVLGIITFSSIVGKFLGYNLGLSIVLGLTSLYGFPGTYILSTEAANGSSSTEEEKSAIENFLLPKMLVAGFVTVTISSVVLAGFLVKFLK